MKDEAMLKIMDSFFSIQADAMPKDADTFIRTHVSYAETDLLKDYDGVVKNLMSGATCLFIDGYDSCIVIDCRTYPARSTEEPTKDKALRGSRDGFVETIVFNTALIRRRIRDPHLIMKMMEIGKTSRSDVVLAYMEDRVNPELLATLQSRLESIDIDALKMNQQTLENELLQKKWYNPFPKCKFTERPDTACACLLEGKIALIVDNSPSVMILPTSIFDMIEEANDYYFPALTGLYLKISRSLITLTTLFLTPVYLLLMEHQEWIPGFLNFIIAKDMVYVPLLLQFLILEIAIDGLRLAALNTPSMLSTPLSVIAGIVMGEFSVSSGWFNSEVMLYMAFVTVANYTQPNYELGYALKFMRMLLLVLTGFFGIWGFVIGTVVAIGSVIWNRTIPDQHYLHVSGK
jgi:stage V sporulation protein AF